MKIRPVGEDLLRADGRSGMENLIFACRNFPKVPKSWKNVHETLLCAAEICSNLSINSELITK